MSITLKKRNEKRDILIKISKTELDTILAALRFWQKLGLSQLGRNDTFMDIATDLGDHAPLEEKEIDKLCEWIND